MLGAMAVWVALSAVEIVGDGACPDPAEVGRRLDQIASNGDRGAPAGRARLSRGGNVLHVELLTAAGDHAAARDLDAHESCADLAAAVAIVVAAWEAELDPGVPSHVDLPPPERRAASATATMTHAARTDRVRPQAGAARWLRAALGVGPDLRVDVGGKTTLGAHAQLLTALLHVEGVGLPI